MAPWILSAGCSGGFWKMAADAAISASLGLFPVLETDYNDVVLLPDLGYEAAHINTVDEFG